MSVDTAQSSCCVLCCSPLYSPGFNIYHAKTVHGQRSFYAKLMEVIKVGVVSSQLHSDYMCSVCATLISQCDQLDYQLSHVTGQVRALFNKMAAMQGVVVSGPPTDDSATVSATHSSSTTVGLSSCSSSEATSSSIVSLAPSANSNNETVKLTNLMTSKQASNSLGWPHTLSASNMPVGVLSAAPTVSVTGDFTDKFVRGIESDDMYRYQCVLCSRLGDCEEAIRQHVRLDHPGADRISFPGSTFSSSASASPAVSGKRKQGGGGSTSTTLPKLPRIPRSISASSQTMADNIAQRMYVCDKCDKAFGCEAYLTRHVVAQSCGRMFGCEYCGREFTRNDKKVRHERSHTGERPFSCQFCARTFSRRDKCTSHERQHVHGVLQPMPCARCGETLHGTAEAVAHRATCREQSSEDVADTGGSLWYGAASSTGGSEVLSPTMVVSAQLGQQGSSS